MSDLEDDYPKGGVRVVAFPNQLSELYPAPRGLTDDGWPPLQLTYLHKYLDRLGCKTVLVEDHYVDRDYIEDLALFYTRSLRAYPNYCRRLHFFSESFDDARWRSLVVKVADRTEAQRFLQNSYLGFSVLRPLPGSPVGRTVLVTFSDPTIDATTRLFGGLHRYTANLAGFVLGCHGLAFQQQDQGVSACATTALWSAIHAIAAKEALALPTPAQITQAASRYLLHVGRPLPSEGLTIEQISEGIRASGLAPLVLRIVSPDHARAHLLAYISSGLAPVMAMRVPSGAGHAVCVVGVKVGPLESPGPKARFCDRATTVKGVYIHDDRLGPYAVGELYQDGSATKIRIRIPGETDVIEESDITALIVPVPVKLRLTVSRMRTLGMRIAQALGARLLPQFADVLTLSCRYVPATEYRQSAHTFGLTDGGIYRLSCELVLSRYVGLIELAVPDGGLYDLVIDTTDTAANPSVLAVVQRSAFPAGPASAFLTEALAKLLGSAAIV